MYVSRVEEYLRPRESLDRHVVTISFCKEDTSVELELVNSKRVRLELE